MSEFPAVPLPAELADLPEAVARAALGFATAYGYSPSRAHALATRAIHSARSMWANGDISYRLVVDHREILFWFQDMTNLDCADARASTAEQATLAGERARTKGRRGRRSKDRAGVIDLAAYRAQREARG